MNIQPSDILPTTNGIEVKRNAGLVRMEFSITGISPLLMNAISEELLLGVRNRERSAKNAARPTLRDEAASKLHLLTDGRPHIPINAFFATLINAGQFIRLDGKRQVSTSTKTVLPGMLSLEDTEYPLYEPGTNNQAKWEVDIQRGRNPNGGELVCIVRPRFDHWEIRGVVEIDQSQMPLSMAREIFDIAGKRIGFLEFSPRHKGTFGRFVINNWKIIKG